MSKMFFSKKRRWLSALLTVCILITVFVFPVNSEEQETVYPNGYEFLAALGMAEESADLNVMPTRSVLAKITSALYVGGAPEGSAADGINIPDINAEDKNASYIYYAVKRGLMHLDENGGFRPDEKITADDVVQAFLPVLGYPAAGANDKYLVQSVKSMLIKNVTFDDGYVTAGGLFSMMYNVMDMKLLEPTGFSADGTLAYRNSDETYLQKKLNIEFYDGILVPSTAYGASNIKYVEVGGKKIFTEDSSKYEAYSGYRVRAYYKTDSYEDKLVYVDTGRFKNSTYKIYAADIIGVSNGMLSFKGASGRADYVDYSNCITFYNGNAVTFSEDLLKISSGVVTVINEGTTYAAIVIEEYQTMLIKGTTGYEIYDDNDESGSGSGRNIKFVDYDNCTIILDGKTITAQDIHTGDVANVYLTKDLKNIKLEISRDTVNGVLEKVNISEGIAEIDGTEYRMTRYFLNNYRNYAKTGIKAEFKLDVNKGIVGVGQVSGNWQYGYFMGKLRAPTYETVNMEIMTLSGTVEKYDIAEGVILNGKKVKNLSIDNTDLTAPFKIKHGAGANGTITETVCNDLIAQVIKYQLDTEGKIAKIRTAEKANATNKDDENALILSIADDQTSETDSAKLMRYQGQGCFFIQTGSPVYVDKNISAIFHVPYVYQNELNAANETINSKPDNKLYSAGSPQGILKNDTEIPYYLAYDVTETGFAKCMMLDNGYLGGTTGKEAFKGESSLKPVLITKTTIALNDDEEKIYRFEGYDGTTSKIWNTSADIVFYTDAHTGNPLIPDAGDLVLLYINSNTKEVEQVKIEIDYSAGDNRKLTQTSDVGADGKPLYRRAYVPWHEEWKTYMGPIIAADETGFKMGINSPHEQRDPNNQIVIPDEITFSLCNTNITCLMYDNETKTVSKADMSKVKQSNAFGENNATYAYVRTSWGRITYIYLYNYE